MNRDSLILLIKNHKGKAVGILLGLLFGTLVLHIGFWYSIFLFVCAGVGLYLGIMHDRGERLAAFFDKIMTKRMK